MADLAAVGQEEAVVFDGGDFDIVDGGGHGYRHLGQTHAMTLDDETLLLEDGQLSLTERAGRDMTGARAGAIHFIGDEISLIVDAVDRETNFTLPVGLVELEHAVVGIIERI